MNQDQGVSADNRENDTLWFDDASVIDPEWVEVRVKTSRGDEVLYRVPRRTHFEKVDQAAR